MPTPNSPATVEVSPTEPGHSMPPPSPGPIRIDAISPSELRVYWIGQPLADNYRVQRAESSDGPWSTIATPPGSASNIEDTGLSEDTQYNYRVRAENAWGASAWVADSAATSPATLLASPATPAAVSVEPASDPGVIKPGVRASPTEPAASDASVNSDVGVINPEPVLASPAEPATVAASPSTIGQFQFPGSQQYRIEYRTADTGTGAGPWQDAGTYWGYERPVLVDLLPSGTTLDVRVIAVSEHTESPGPVETFQTLLPPLDASDLTLGTGLEDTLTVSWPDVLDTGEYDIQIKEASADGWGPDAAGFIERTLPAGTSDTTFSGLPDGEEYAVRVRLATGSRVSAWTEPREVTTQFPGLQNVSVESVGPTSVRLEFTDQSDNETGIRVERQRYYADRDSYGDWATVATLAPIPGDASTAAYVDDTVLPSTTYRYRLTAVAEDAAVTSDALEVASASTGRPDERVPASGPLVRVQHPDGEWVTASVVDDIVPSPSINALPEIRIPVPRDDRWEVFVEQPVRVWIDGRRQPVDQIDRVEQSPGESELVAVGGTDLRTDVQRDIVEQPVHEAVRDLIHAETGLAANVDEPTGTRREGIPLGGAGTRADWEALLADPLSETEPVAYREGAPTTLATLDPGIAGADITPEPGVDVVEEVDSDRLINNRAVRFGSAAGNAIARTQLGLAYRLPSSRVGVALRVENLSPGSEHVSLEVRVDGSTVSTLGTQLFIDDEGMQWYELFDAGGTLGSLAGGSHEIAIEAVADPGTDSQALDVNAVAVYDTRSYDGLESVVSGGEALGPQTHAHDPALETRELSGSAAIVGGRLSAELSGVGGGQSVSVSQDGGQSWHTSANTDTVDVDWTTPGDSLRGRITLSSTPSDVVAGLARDEGQSVESVSLTGDLREVPVLSAAGVDDSLADVLSQWADEYDSLWGVTWGEEGLQVEWTQPGQRPVEIDTDVIDYEYSRDASTVIEEARVHGAARGYTESVEASVGERVSLAREHVVAATEEVRGPDGVVYEQGVDYLPRYVEGSLEMLASGDISAGETLDVEYQYTIVESYRAAGVTDPRSQRVDLNLATERGCEQAAIYLVENLSDPVVSAELRIPRQAVGWDVLNAVTAPRLPGERHQIQRIREEGGEIVVALESRDSVGDVVEDLRRDQTSNTRRV